MAENKLKLCPHCLAALQSREGRQCFLTVDVELDYDPEEQESIVCDWCEDWYPTLYEIQ